MESFQALLHMGGYGGYVWPAYGAGAVVLALVLILSMSAARKAESELEALQQVRRARKAKDSETEE